MDRGKKKITFLMKILCQKVFNGKKVYLPTWQWPKAHSKTDQKEKQVNIHAWPSQSPDLNPIENLWNDLKTAVHKRSPSNVTELEQFCKEELANIAKSRCATLVEMYPNRLKAVIKAKDCSTKYWHKGMIHFPTQILFFPDILVISFTWLL